MISQKGNVLVLTLIGLLVFVFGVAGYFFWQNRELKKGQDTVTPPQINEFPAKVKRSSEANKLFTVNQELSQGKTVYSAMLFDSESSAVVKSKEIDLSIIPYSLTPIESRFSAAYTSEPFCTRTMERLLEFSLCS